MGRWKNILLASPLFLSTILFFVKTIAGILGQGASFDILHFYFVDNLEFSMAIGLILTEFAVALIVFSSETQQKLSGKWEIQFCPKDWKGRTDARILGKGDMYLARSPYGGADFIGYMYVAYRDAGYTLLHKGIYEIRFTLQRKRVNGQSLMIWGQSSDGEYDTNGSDASYVNPCVYDLNYSPNRQRLEGEAKMTGGPTVCQFEAYRL